MDSHLSECLRPELVIRSNLVMLEASRRWARDTVCFRVAT